MNTSELPNDIKLEQLQKLLMFSDRYEISIQFLPDQIAAFISKDEIDLQEFGGSFKFAVGITIRNKSNGISNEE